MHKSGTFPLSRASLTLQQAFNPFFPNILPAMGARKIKTKRMTRGLDQIHADLLSPKHLAQRVKAKPAEDLPGLGRFYCIECAKWFESEHSLVHHRKGRPHKRRLRALREEPYTQKEADAAAGLATDSGIRKNANPNEGREEISMDVELTNG